MPRAPSFHDAGLGPQRRPVDRHRGPQRRLPHSPPSRPQVGRIGRAPRRLRGRAPVPRLRRHLLPGSRHHGRQLARLGPHEHDQDLTRPAPCSTEHRDLPRPVAQFRNENGDAPKNRPGEVSGFRRWPSAAVRRRSTRWPVRDEAAADVAEGVVPQPTGEECLRLSLTFGQRGRRSALSRHMASLTRRGRAHHGRER